MKLLFLRSLLCGVAQLKKLILVATYDGADSKVLAYGMVVVCALFQFVFILT